MSREDYLSKYLKPQSNNRKLKRGKKSTKIKNDASVSSEDKGILNLKVEDATMIPTLDGFPSDEEGIKVEKKLTKQYGFRRIDNGEIYSVAEATKKTENIGNEKLQNQQGTIYRDASGHIIDIEARRKELAERKKKEREESDKKRYSLNTGDMQKYLDSKKTNDLNLLKSSDHIEHLEKHDSLMRTMSRLDDPVQVFDDHTNNIPEANSNLSVTGRPYYQKGVNPANRYGIRAGYLWDGIDRSNGYEQLRIRKKNESDFNKRALDDAYDFDVDI